MRRLIACWRLEVEVTCVPIEFKEGELTGIEKMKVLKYEIDSASAPKRRFEDRKFETSPKVIRWNTNQLVTAFVAFAFSISLVVVARASGHLDSPATVANPAAEIGDVCAWTSPEGKQLNLAMTIQGHAFSDKVEYTFHIDSGKAFDRTSATTSIVCRFAAPSVVKCNLGSSESAAGDPTEPTGLEGRNHRFRVYAAAPIKVVSSWVIAVAILAATLQLLPVTPGCLPDHLE
jgi:hypothetical protein